MEPELAAALRLDRDLRLRAAPETCSIAAGWVVRHSGVPVVHHLNAVLLSAPLASGIDADAVVALSERWLGDLGHRHVVFEDAGAGEGLAPTLLGRGWERSRTLFMAFAGEPGAALSDPRTRKISDAAMREQQLIHFEREGFPPGAPAEVRAQLVAAQQALRAATPAVCLGAGEDGSVQATCTLFLDAEGLSGRMAMIEEVSTLPDYRRRGLARAVVCAAIRAAAEWDADLIVVPADADDWPQLLYAGLGFEPIGMQVSFTRRSSVSGGV